MTISYTSVIREVAAAVQKAFRLPVHSDEILEGFAMPCFFIRFIPTTTIETLNVTRTVVSIVLTYFTNTRDELEYFQVEDRIRDLFDIGFYVDGRYIHVDSFSDDRFGQEKDILQIIVTVSYSNKTRRLLAKEAADADLSRRADTLNLALDNDMAGDAARRFTQFTGSFTEQKEEHHG